MTTMLRVHSLVWQRRWQRGCIVGRIHGVGRGWSAASTVTAERLRSVHLRGDPATILLVKRDTVGLDLSIQTLVTTGNRRTLLTAVRSNLVWIDKTIYRVLKAYID